VLIITKLPNNLKIDGDLDLEVEEHLSKSKITFLPDGLEF